MSNKLRSVRGMKDLLGDEYKHHQYIVQKAEDIGKLFGFQSIATPILEYSSVFSRTLGDTSEVVSKEMYDFLDKGGDSVTLRPEFTASIMRSFISNGLNHELPLRLFSSGPVFRYDRPQAGRQRQFHQINFEYLGADGPYSDAEMLALASKILDDLGILQYTKLELNSLGSKDSREKYALSLQEYFGKYESELSEDSKVRLSKNPLRILDSKDEKDQEIVQNAPLMSDFYSDEDKKYLDEILGFLDLFNVKYSISPRLVRGLDYYCHTAFEFTTDKLGSQSTVLAGGRYDGLSKMMSGPPDLKAIGFAGGIERIMLLRDGFSPKEERPLSIVPISDENIPNAITLSQKLRENGIISLIQHKGKLAKKMQNSNKANSKYVVVMGEDEIKSKIYNLKNMDDGTEIKISEEELLKL